MDLPAFINKEVIWNKLQEPIHHTDQPNDYLLLLTALDLGWEINSPVFACPPRDGSCSGQYYFSMRNPKCGRLNWLYLLMSAEMERYLQDECLQIVYIHSTHANILLS